VSKYKNLFADSAVYPNMIYINTFTTTNSINSGFSFRFHSGLSDSTFKQYFTYNAVNKLIEDSTYELHLGVWRMASRTYYTYDASNNLIQIDNYANTTDTSFLLPLVEQLKYVNTYDASNRLLTVLNYTYDGASLSQYVKDTFAYTGTYKFHTAWRETQWDPINGYWAPMFNMTKTINTLGLPDTVLIRSFDSVSNAWVPHTMDVMTYNTFPDPATLKDYEYNFSYYPPTPNYTTTYYYQPYINALETHNTHELAGTLTVFPNPATAAATLSDPDLPEHTQVAITLLNAAGQLISRQIIPWANNTQLQLTGLLPGAYYILIQDKTGNIVQKAQIVKL
jgi:hypothetical protein